jgi:hypothetical protein
MHAHVFHGSSSRLLAQGSSRAAMCPWLQLPPPDSGQLRYRHLSRCSSSRLLAQDRSEAATCPMELYGLWDIEVNKYPPMA